MNRPYRILPLTSTLLIGFASFMNLPCWAEEPEPREISNCPIAVPVVSQPGGEAPPETVSPSSAETVPIKPDPGSENPTGSTSTGTALTNSPNGDIPAPADSAPRTPNPAVSSESESSLSLNSSSPPVSAQTSTSAVPEPQEITTALTAPVIPQPTPSDTASSAAESVIPVRSGVPQASQQQGAEAINPPPADSQPTLPAVANQLAPELEADGNPHTRYLPVPPVDGQSTAASAEGAQSANQLARLCPPSVESSPPQVQPEVQATSVNAGKSAKTVIEDPEIKRAIEHTKRSMRGLHPF